MTAASSKDLWTTENIATYLGLSRKHITDRVVKQKGFPKPEIASSTRNRRWHPEKVRAWAAGGGMR